VKKNTVAFITLILLLSSFRLFAQQWQAVGPDDKAQFFPDYSDLIDASFVNSTPYILMNGGKYEDFIVRFRRLNSTGTAWEDVSAVSNAQNATNITGIISSDNTPYIAYLDASYKLCALKGNGTNNWSQVGKKEFTAGTVKYQTIAVNGNKVYVAFSDATTANKLTVMKLNDDGVNWDVVGRAGFSAGAAYNISMGFIGDTPYVAFRDLGAYSQARLIKLNAAGTAWEKVGNDISTGAIASMSFGISNATPYVAYTVAELINNNTHVRKLNAAGTAWVDVATTPVPGIAEDLKLQFGGGTLFLSYNDFQHDTRVSVFKLNAAATGWLPVGNSDLSSGMARETILRTIDQQPYLFFTDAGLLNKARAMKLNSTGTTWQDITTSGFSEIEPFYPNIVFNGDIPYTIYLQGGSASNATVRKFTGGQWQVVGKTGFLRDGSTYKDKMPLVFKNNVPYVAYIDGDHQSKLSVKRLNAAGTDWEQVGTAGFASGGSTTRYSVKMVTDGTAIYASAGPTVMKLGAGGVWQPAAPLASDPGETINAASLAINNSTLYIAYASESNGGIRVKKLNSSGTWELVGGKISTITTAPLYTMSLVFNNSTPYLSTREALYKLNATATGWDVLGPSTYHGPLYAQVAFEGNVPYVSGIDDLGARAFVQYYDAASNTWKAVGNNDPVTRAAAIDISIAIHNRKIYAFMDEGGAFVRSFGFGPGISSFSPTSATTDATVTIHGGNFTGAQTVTFGGVAAKSYKIVSDTLITAVVGAGASGSVVISSGAGSAELKGFVFTPPLPVITTFYPARAAQNATVTITGKNFNKVTAVTFGGVPAASFTVNSSTSITAVVGNGASGEVDVVTSAGTAKYSSFTFVPPASIKSFSPVTAGTGDQVIITGQNLTGTTAVTFGGQSAYSFTVNSSASITAVVGKGASGNVVITAPGGTANLPGFTYKPLLPPTMSSYSPVEATTGDTITINGTNFNKVTSVAFGGSAASNFIVKSDKQILAVVGKGSSGSVKVTTAAGAIGIGGFIFIPKLPKNNYKLSVTSATCKGSADGSISITTVAYENYTVTISGSGINKASSFNSDTKIDGLPAGTYSVCFTIDNQAGYSNCDNIVIAEPKDLSVYSVLNTNNTLDLQMDGGAIYNITLNGKLYMSTTGSTASIPLPDGDNDIMVSTDKLCQGIIEKIVNIAGRLVPYPNPSQGLVKVNLGDKPAAKITVDVKSASDGKLVFSDQYLNRSGVLQVDLSAVANGIYIFHIVADNVEHVFKVIKK
jgi:hypothetical protein